MMLCDILHKQICDARECGVNEVEVVNRLHRINDRAASLRQMLEEQVNAKQYSWPNCQGSTIMGSRSNEEEGTTFIRAYLVLEVLYYLDSLYPTSYYMHHKFRTRLSPELVPCLLR